MRTGGAAPARFRKKCQAGSTCLTLGLDGDYPSSKPQRHSFAGGEIVPGRHGDTKRPASYQPCAARYLYEYHTLSSTPQHHTPLEALVDGSISK